MWFHIKKFDWLLIGSVLTLCTMGILVLFGIDKGSEGSNFFNRQIIFLGLGISVMFLVSFLDCRIFRNYSAIFLILYFLLLALLVGVLFFGRNIRGTVGWFVVGGLRFEPVEFAKLVIILVLAKYFSGRHVEMFRIRHIIASAIYVFVPIGLVLFQPDLGSAMILATVWLGTVILSGIKLRHLIIVLLCGAALALLAWGLALKPYQKERVLTFLNPTKDPLGYSYSLIQSKIAIGSGGIWGKGLGRGSQGQLNFLPEKQTDFIFALLAEEWGLAGVLFMLAVFLLFFWRLTKIALACDNNFFRLFTAGFTLMIFAQTFINVGMDLGLMPITGISLPFLSYGGSNLLVNFLALGVILNIVTQTKLRVTLERD